MENVWNDETFALLTMSLSPQLTTHFVDSRVISFDLDLSATTPENCAHKCATMTVELQRMISWWSLSGKGDEDLDEDEYAVLSQSLIGLRAAMSLALPARRCLSDLRRPKYLSRLTLLWILSGYEAL